MRGTLAVALLLTVAASGQATESRTPCGKITTKYYSWAELKRFPPRPSHPESEAWAQNQERTGGSHYIAEFCENGDIISLTKRLDKKVFFRYEYIYDGGKLTAVQLIDEQGKQRIEKGG
jgi:hypothetical protein